VIKGPESARAQKILNDPHNAQRLVEAILASREQQNGAGQALIDGGIRVTLVDSASLPVRAKD
jgi:hypothetical protein